MNIIRSKRVWIHGSLILVSAGVIFLALSLAPPSDFEEPVIVKVNEGDTLADIAEELRSENVIRSTFWLRTFVILSEGERNIPAGDYSFTDPEPVYRIADRLRLGEQGLDPVRVTIPEGWNVFDVADLLERNFEAFDREYFLSRVEEGFLFPETYFFSPTADTDELIDRMEGTFSDKMEPYEDDIERLPYDTHEIVTMASLLETEANTVESKRKIADILWRRLEDGMPLQVDAAFSYVNGKNTYQLTYDDLEMDHPYNTYRNTGLPPTPIANPGLNAIEAAIYPKENSYWYFLSDLAGNMYYARDFDEHQINRANYLRQ